MDDESELLFFDTFSHETCEELNLDLVQFPRPVYIFEIRVIPLGARVQADFPGGHRLGATNPSSFQLEVYINDLSKRAACTFDKVGNFQYKQNVEIQFPIPNRILTDGIVLRGLYSAVTLAVYGVLAKTITKERSSPPPPPPPQSISRSQHQDHRSDRDSSISSEWDRHSRPVEIKTEPQSTHHPHPQVMVEGSRFSEVSSIMHPQAEPHVQYTTEMSQPVYPEPPPNMVYPECIPATVPSVPAPAYQQYDARYQKPWPSSMEEHYPSQSESYDSQVYRPPDPNTYPPPASISHSMWDTKECHSLSEMNRSERDPYEQSLHEHNLHSRGKERRDKPWDRDSGPSDYKDDDLSRDRDYKRKERDHRSWERDSDRYRDRMKESSSRDREKERDRDRGRDKPRNHDSYSDRSLRTSSKRPVTPPTSPSTVHARPPQTPPDLEKVSGGPRTPKEEPPEPFEERGDAEGEIPEGDNTDDDGYEEIVSEEEIMSDGEDHLLDMAEIDYDLGDETWNYMSSFSPYHCELTSCQHFTNPAFTELEKLSCKKNKSKENSSEADGVNENKLIRMIDSFKNQEHTERWVEALESLNSSDLAHDLSSIKSTEVFNSTVESLIDWVIEGLNFDLALKQPQTAFKVRHIKAGARLALLLFRTNAVIIDELLEHEVPRLLLEMFDQPYMALPVKLLLLRALDAVTFTKKGMDFLLKREFRFNPPCDFEVPPFQANPQINAESVCKTGYQKLLEVLLSKQLTRAVLSVSALLKKLHLFEVLQEFQEAVESLVQTIQTLEQKPAGQEEPQNPSGAIHTESYPVESHMDAVNSAKLEELINIIITCLNEMSSAYHSAWKKLAQPKRLSPSRKVLESPNSPYDPYPGLLRMLQESGTIESILHLILSPMLLNHTSLMNAVREFMMELLQTQNGLLFLLSRTDTINSIQKALLQNVDETRDESAEENVVTNLGMQIAYRLQALLYVDNLFLYHEKGGPKKDLDGHEAVSVLHHMYTMVFSPIGRVAVVDILSYDHNLSALFPFVRMTGDEEFDVRLSKSVCAGYVTELLTLTVHHSENVSVMENFSKELFDLSQQESKPKLLDLRNWVSPAQKIQSYTHEAIPYLTGILKSHLEDATALPPELITSVRILKYISHPPADEPEDMQRMYPTIQLFANDGMSYFITILQNICDTFMKPSHQSVALVGFRGVLLVALVKPIVSMIKCILGCLISCRASEFQDLTAVPVLLQVYSLMLMVPTSSFSYHLAAVVQNDVVETLLSYTQPSPTPEETEESLSKSLWTRMVSEVLAYAQKTPRSFITGLSVFSELLPLPLPLQTREPLGTEEINRTINHRKLWSAHLRSLCGTLQEMIIGLAATSCHPLLQLLRRVCIQLADLAAPTALVIVRAVIDSLLDAVEAEHKDENNSGMQPLTEFNKPCSLYLTRILNLIAYLVSHAAFKIPFIHILKAGMKVDEKYAEVLPCLLNILNFPCEKSIHIQAQECIASILQSLCDPDIGFITVENGASVTEVLGSCLPSKEQMVQICAALIQHVSSKKHHFASMLPCLRSLVMLTEHDYGFYHVKQCLEQHSEALYSLLSHLSSSFSKDNPDCLSTLSTCFEFLRLMVNGYEEGAQTGRSMLLTASELASFLTSPGAGSKVKQEDSSAKQNRFQVLLDLEKYLSDCSADEDTFESLLDSLAGLLVVLNEGLAKEEKSEVKDVAEPVLPSPEPLAVQFSSRTVFLTGVVEEERLNPAYWLSVAVSDDAEQDPEQVTLDLMSLSEKYISGSFNLKNTLEKMCSSDEAGNEMKDKMNAEDAKMKCHLNNSGTTDAGIKRTFIAPMRGRGFSRATTHSTRANDPFRSRPPNTSRPPSMHVDDFVALESHHNGAGGAPQQKRPEGSRGRGRGFDRQLFASTRGGGGSGRFFTPPGPYGRRELGARTEQCGSRGTNRLSGNAWGSRANPSVPKSPTSLGVRTSFSNRPSQRSRDPYSELPVPPGAISIRSFSRGVRVGGIGAPVQGHWQETRNKAQNQRFMSNTAQPRGSARRDLSDRHARSFTR